MEKSIVTTGKTIDLAVEAALTQLGLSRDDVSVMVLAQAKPGFLGIGATPAKVQVTYEAPDLKPEAPKSALGSASRSKPKAAAPVKKPEAPKVEPKPEAPKAAPAPKAEVPAGGKKVTSPLPGSVIKVLVSEGQAVKKGDTLLTLESMKMENAIMAECDATVTKVVVSAGQTVMQEDLLVVLG